MDGRVPVAARVDEVTAGVLVVLAAVDGELLLSHETTERLGVLVGSDIVITNINHSTNKPSERNNRVTDLIVLFCD